jgi:molybdopterin-containing oxidoreductase family iron-sulfur binding subunit
MADERKGPAADGAATGDGLSRRRFLSVVGVSGAGAAVLSGCSTDKVERLIPYLVQAEDQVPGVATIYASTCTECSAGCGLHVITREARAVKLEGNPEHPVNKGKLCSRGQAALQGLYNPGRVRNPRARQGGAFADLTWDAGITQLADRIKAAGSQVAVLSGAGAGTFSNLLQAWTAALGGRVARWQPLDHDAIRMANARVFGLGELPAHDFARARYIVSFGADFLETWLAPIQNQAGYAESHGFQNGEMAKAVYVGPRRDLTGLNADEWHPVAPGSETVLALAMANIILSERSGAPDDANTLRGMLSAHTAERAAQATGMTAEAVTRLAREFASATPGLAVAGGIGSQHRGAVELCAAVGILNYVAGNIGQTVHFGARLDHGDGLAGLQSLQQAMDAGQVQVLIIHEANPVYSLPKSSKFAESLAKVPFKVSTSLFFDETAALCDLLLPNHHALERWDDLEPRAGVRSLLQPVMEPVFQTRATGDVLLGVARAVGGALAGFNAASFEAHLRAAWGGTDDAWREALRRGGVYTDAPATPVRLAAGAQAAADLPRFDGEGEFTLIAYPHSMYYDGRGANRPWLLENPDPITKRTWQSWVEIHPETAGEIDIRDGEHLRLTSANGSIDVPVYLYAGVRRDVLAVPLGLGHTEYGEYATGRGVNPADLLPWEAGQAFLSYGGTRVQATKVQGAYTKPAKTEGNPRQLGRGIVEAMPLALARRGLTVKEAYAAEGHPEHEINTEREVEAIEGWRDKQVEMTQFGGYVGEHPKWALTVDLSRCTGCSACVTACYAENNIPWVGEDEVRLGREMSWMRIERYWEGGEDGEQLEARFIPMMCQHCDNAPCEPVCPVYAAYHTPEGLNGQVYNRCVGTRYCANNCPYKVRYFNWYAYARKAFPEPMNLQLNPEVTVRARGVMEKCTFCVQRIRGAQHRARLEDREVGTGEIITACAQACPSHALEFGNVHNPDSRVVALANDHRAYHVLEEINVRPAVTYLAKVLHEAEA